MVSFSAEEAKTPKSVVAAAGFIQEKHLGWSITLVLAEHGAVVLLHWGREENQSPAAYPYTNTQN